MKEAGKLKSEGAHILAGGEFSTRDGRTRREDRRANRRKQVDPASKFWFIQNEAQAYKFMLAVQNLPKGKGKEVVGVLSINQATGGKGVLILPWVDNQYDRSDPTKGFYGNFYEDHDGNHYSPIAIVHTHPENDIGPETWARDLETIRELSMPAFIIGNLNYVQFNPPSPNVGSIYDLINTENSTSLFPN